MQSIRFGALTLATTLAPGLADCDDDGPTDPGDPGEFDGDPGGESFSVQGAQTGGISWDFEGGSGGCSVDLSFNSEGSTVGLSRSGTVSGTVCGVDVSESLQVGA